MLFIDTLNSFIKSKTKHLVFFKADVSQEDINFLLKYGATISSDYIVLTRDVVTKLLEIYNSNFDNQFKFDYERTLDALSQ